MLTNSNTLQHTTFKCIQHLKCGYNNRKITSQYLQQSYLLHNICYYEVLNSLTSSQLQFLDNLSIEVLSY